MGIHNYYDVIYHLPRRYEDYTPSDENHLVDGKKISIEGTIISSPKLVKTARTSITTFDFYSSKKKYYRVVAFNREYLSKIVKINDTYTVYGVYDKKRNEIDMINLQKGIIVPEEYIKPIYSLPQELKNHEFVRLVKKAFKEVESKFISFVPFYFANKYGLVDKKTALFNAHFPSNRDNLKKSLLFLKYEEALKFALNNRLIKEENYSIEKYKSDYIEQEMLAPMISQLPFQLTHDQLTSIDEILKDLNDEHLMYRLLQGDVGSGKTVVSFVAMYANYLRGRQSALMCPTEVLARQHYENAKRLFAFSKVNIRLLVGSIPNDEKKSILNDLQDGVIDIIIGTHSLFSKNVIYNSLGLVVIDEQHRFGVNQRLALLGKDDHADLLMMSATPIPRSLALSLYGDLDISTIVSAPQQTRDIKTIVCEKESEQFFSYIDEALKSGHKVYVVLPLIEFGEKCEDSIETVYPIFEERYPKEVQMLHGKMKSEEKEKAIAQFASGEKPLLVSTQVIEVGIDVRDATLMIIYGANNFGLASLHQLRGRIGRDGQPSLCVCLIDSMIDDEGKERLKVFCNTNDGFELAELDLKSRGPGELVGLKQSGLPDFHFLNVVNDVKIFKIAREDAKYIFDNQMSNQNFLNLIELLKKSGNIKKISKG